MSDDCEALQARAAMLHREAALGLEKALDHGPTWPGFAEQVQIADRCDALAADVEIKIAEDC